MKLKNWKSLLDNSLWTLDTVGEPRWWRVIVRFVKLVRITVGTFMDNRMGFQCVALSYFAALATVPFVAFLFTISGGIGLSGKLADILLNAVPGYPDVIGLIMDKASNIVEVAQSGPLGAISAFFFLWTILWMMFQVERVFNNVWNIKKIPRKIHTRFGFYLLLLFLSPFVVLIFGSGIAVYLNLPNILGLEISEWRFLPQLLGWSALFLVVFFTTSAMYKFIPATFVRYKYAMKAAALSALCFTLFQYVYLETQVFVARLNAVYGVIAAVPLFLIWLNFSWQIIIYGAELTYSYQNVDSYNIPEWQDETLKR